MAHDRAARQHTVLVELRRTGLPHHFVNGRHGKVAVILRVRVKRSVIAAVIFIVRQVDVHVPFEHTQRFRALVAARIIDNGYRQSLCSGNIERMYDLWHVMCAGHKVDVGRALFLKRQKGRGQALGRNRAPGGLSAADGTVLAEHAAERTMRKEHGSRAFFARNDRLFP